MRRIFAEIKEHATGKRLSRLLFVVAAAFSLTTGCGYQHPSSSRINQQGSIALYAGMWANQTNEFGLESVIHRAVNDRLMESTFIRLTPTAAQADFLLNGTIRSVNFPGLSYNVFTQAEEFRAELTVRYTLTEKKTGKVIWEVHRDIREEPYKIGTDAITTQSAKKGALAIIAEDLAEVIYVRTQGELAKHPAKDR